MKTSTELRQELAEAVAREEAAVRENTIKRFKDIYEDKYFWFKREYKTAQYVGMCHLSDFNLRSYSSGTMVAYQAKEIRLVTNSAPPARWEGSEGPNMGIFYYPYESCATFEEPSRYREKVKDGTKQEFTVLLRKLREIIATNFGLFSGGIAIDTDFPEVETPDRLITTGQL